MFALLTERLLDERDALEGGQTFPPCLGAVRCPGSVQSFREAFTTKNALGTFMADSVNVQPASDRSWIDTHKT
jgi:hypothetical protein